MADAARKVKPKIKKMGEPPQDALAPQPPRVSFLGLPLELRNMIYDLLIEETTISTSPPPCGLQELQTPIFSRPHKFDLHVSNKNIRYPNLALPSNLMYTCQQVYAELSILICSRIQHLKLTGDFMMGLSSTATIFKMLSGRPWIASSIRTVNVMLKMNQVLPLRVGGVAVNTHVLEQHPWLGKRLKMAELKIKKFDMKERGMDWVARGWWQTTPKGIWGFQWCLETLGMKTRDGERKDDFNLGDLDNRSGQLHNTLPDLAKLFETFPLLEKINIETEHRHLLSLFPSPRDTAESFRALEGRGVKVNILLNQWQVQSFCNMLYRNGVERGTIRFRDGATGKLALSYERLPDGQQRAHPIISFRLIDCVLRSEEAQLSRWKMLGETWRWKKRKGDATEENGRTRDLQ